jgi:hypothetical protein
MYGRISAIETAREVLLAHFGLQTGFDDSLLWFLACTDGDTNKRHWSAWCEVAMQLNVFSWIDQESSETLCPLPRVNILLAAYRARLVTNKSRRHSRQSL